MIKRSKHLLLVLDHVCVRVCMPLIALTLVITKEKLFGG